MSSASERMSRRASKSSALAALASPVMDCTTSSKAMAFSCSGERPHGDGGHRRFFAVVAGVASGEPLPGVKDGVFECEVINRAAQLTALAANRKYRLLSSAWENAKMLQ